MDRFILSSQRKRWQNRFFVLSGHYLKYYEDQKQATTKGVIDVNELQGCELDEDGLTLELTFSEAGFDVKVLCPRAAAMDSGAHSDPSSIPAQL